jgi:hypothetical protein
MGTELARATSGECGVKPEVLRISLKDNAPRPVLPRAAGQLSRGPGARMIYRILVR